MKVVFDIGKVLATAHMEWKDALAASGLAYQSSPLVSKKLYDLSEYLPYEGGQISEGRYLEAVSKAFGLEGIDAARHLHRSIIGAEYPGVAAIVDQLNASGVHTATLSNNNPIHWEWFTKSGKYPAIERIKYPIASFHLGYFKPDPKIFAAFCDYLDWSPADIVFLDDSAVNVEAAQTAGWTAHVITDGEPKADQIRRILHLSDR
ncbi:MAG: HAD-IA family hydrolase [Armatimonadetes bacterium]|nr:HAD-IA family hydrolase [Armatimonadota bacterium]